MVRPNTTPSWDRSLCGHCSSSLDLPCCRESERLLIALVIGSGLTFLLYQCIYLMGKSSPTCHLLGQGIYCALLSLLLQPWFVCGWSKPSCLVLYWSWCWPRKVFISLFWRLPKMMRRFSTCFFSPDLSTVTICSLWKWPKACCNYLSWSSFVWLKLLLCLLIFSHCPKIGYVWLSQRVKITFIETRPLWLW